MGKNKWDVKDCPELGQDCIIAVREEKRYKE